MQKNDKSYTFLLKHSSKSKIYIRRVEVSKRHLHFGPIGLLLFIGVAVTATGINGLLNSKAFAETLSKTSLITKISAESPQATARMDRTVPALASELAVNSGGPENDVELDGENAELESQLGVIRSSTNQANLPTMWAHLGKINNEFGFRRNPFGGRSYEFHPGMDIDGERGEQILAPANGVVIKAGVSGGYGNMVEIDHGNGLTTRYGHMSKIDAQAGEMVTRGQVIGYVGSTGRSTGPHLHYELRLNDKPINPRHFLPQEPIDLEGLSK
jgi:murein DD-endopeptidase MepM/ murein hydrolase activator NlpD